MELKQLRIFLAVAEELHFGRAAERLHIAQPALSAQLKSLEDWLGVRLFFRTTRSVSLTRAGEAFLPEAKATLAQAAAAVSTVRTTAGDGAELLKIGGVDSATAGLLPEVVRAFRRDFTGIEIKITEILSAPALHALSNHHLDLAFVRIAPDGDEFNSRTVFSEPIMVALPAEHRLAEAVDDDITLANLASEPLVIPARSHRPILFDMINGLFQSRGLEPRILQEANERHMIVAMVAAGLGVSLVPHWVTQFRRDDVVFRRIADSTPLVDVHVVWRNNETMAAVHDFVRYLPSKCQISD